MKKNLKNIPLRVINNLGKRLFFKKYNFHYFNLLDIVKIWEDYLTVYCTTSYQKDCT